MAKRLTKLTTVLKLDSNMRLLVPSHIREAMGLTSKDILLVTLDKNVTGEEEVESEEC